MLAMTLTCLFAIATIATGLSLLDSWLRGRGAYLVLRREEALLRAGFVPQVHAHELRLRKAPARHTLATATRSKSRRTPVPVFQSAA